METLNKPFPVSRGHTSIQGVLNDTRHLYPILDDLFAEHTGHGAGLWVIDQDSAIFSRI